MRCKDPLLFLLASICNFGALNAQPWTGILSPSRAIDWSTAGVPGGIPARTTICTNWYNGSGAPSSSLGNNGDYYFNTAVAHGSAEYTKASGSWAATGNEFYNDANAALSACPSGDAVYLNAGTYYVASSILVPSNVTLRGAGANQTILNANNTSGAVVALGNNGGGGSDTVPSLANQTSIIGGLTAGSTSITVSATVGMSVGGYLLISQLNDSSFVSNSATNNNGGSVCNCDGGIGWNGTRNQGQIVEITSISGTTIGITSGGAGASSNPGLYYAYNKTPVAVPFSAAAKYAGIENLQVYANNTGYSESFYMGMCAYCWASGVESNYTDGDWAEIDWGFHDQIQNSYFSNAYLHTPGTFDSDVAVRTFSSAFLIQNNIMERGHASIMLEWGPNGGVVAYNYTLGNFDSIDFDGSGNACTSTVACANMSGINSHGAHPMWNLVEGNVTTLFEPDNVWGSSSNWTLFRNWVQGTTKICPPVSGRGTVSCASGQYAYQIAYAYEVEAYSTNVNSVGNVVGSAAAQSLVNLQDNGTPALVGVRNTVAESGTGIPTPSGANSRSYGGATTGYSFGYFSVSDTGGSSGDTNTPYSTLFQHGDYDNISKAITWASGVAQTLPASFYLSSKPAWWGSSLPYPAVGPDVTGGSGPHGYAYGNPAEACYTNVMGGIDGTGSPLSFNANNCYAAASTLSPPTNLSAVAN